MGGIQREHLTERHRGLNVPASDVRLESNPVYLEKRECDSQVGGDPGLDCENPDARGTGPCFTGKADMLKGRWLRDAVTDGLSLIGSIY